MTEREREREERALDALLVSALRKVDKDELIDPRLLPELTSEEELAMRSLGDDFIERVLALAESTASKDRNEGIE